MTLQEVVFVPKQVDFQELSQIAQDVLVWSQLTLFVASLLVTRHKIFLIKVLDTIFLILENFQVAHQIVPTAYSMPGTMH